MRADHVSAYLGVVGMTGHGGMYGLTKIMEPKAGETIVSARRPAPVGAWCKLARIAGCGAVAICRRARTSAGTHARTGIRACIDYKTAAMTSRAGLIAAPPPKGVDAHFENVGAMC